VQKHAKSTLNTDTIHTFFFAITKISPLSEFPIAADFWNARRTKFANNDYEARMPD
jgi:hypothetical protein